MGWRLAVVGVAVGVLLSAAINRNGCYRHDLEGPDLAAAVDVAAEHLDATHPICPGCAAASIGAATLVASSTDVVGPDSITGLDLSRSPAPPSGDATLSYAPKTSPPRV